eukprot:RCo003963
MGQPAKKRKLTIDVSFKSKTPVDKITTPQSAAGFTASEIIPSFLFLGTEKDACNTDALRSRNIRYVLNVAKECEVKNAAEVAVLSIPLEDAIDENIYSHFSAACDFIDSARTSGRAVLVNCRMGISRSCTFVAAYLMSHLRCSREEALLLIRSKRQIVSPNLGFLLALEDWEAEVRRCSNTPWSRSSGCSSSVNSSDRNISTPCASPQARRTRTPPLTATPPASPVRGPAAGVVVLLRSPSPLPAACSSHSADGAPHAELLVSLSPRLSPRAARELRAAPAEHEGTPLTPATSAPASPASPCDTSAL